MITSSFLKPQEGVRPPIYFTQMEQEVYVKAGILESEIEAQLLDSVLNERNIPHHIQSYHDTAYDGLFQTQRGWGHVSCPISWSEEIGTILSEIRESAEQGARPITA